MEILVDAGMIRLRSPSTPNNTIYNIYSSDSYFEEVYTAFELRQQIKKLEEAAKQAEYNLKGIKC